MVQYIIKEKNTDNKRVHPTRTYMETQNTVRIQFSAQRVLSKFAIHYYYQKFPIHQV